MDAVDPSISVSAATLGYRWKRSNGTFSAGRDGVRPRPSGGSRSRLFAVLIPVLRWTTWFPSGVSCRFASHLPRVWCTFMRNSDKGLTDAARRSKSAPDGPLDDGVSGTFYPAPKRFGFQCLDICHAKVPPALRATLGVFCDSRGAFTAQFRLPSRRDR